MLQEQAASASLDGLRDDAGAAPPACPLTNATQGNAPPVDSESQLMSPIFNLGILAQPTGFGSGAQDQALPIPPVLPSNAPPLDYDWQISTADFNFGAGATPDSFVFRAQEQSLTTPTNNNGDIASQTPAPSSAAESTTPFVFGSQTVSTTFNFGASTPQTTTSSSNFTAQPECTHPQIPNSFDFGAQTATCTLLSKPTPFTFGATTTQSFPSNTIYTPESPSIPSTVPSPGTYRDEASGRIWQLGSGAWVTETEYYARLSYEAFMGGEDEKGFGYGGRGKDVC